MSSKKETAASQAEELQLKKLVEDKIKAKYPTCGLSASGSAFLQKRLQKGQKYFDSGDYQMAKQTGGGMNQVFANNVSTGGVIPTPDTVPARKTPILQQPSNKLQNAPDKNLNKEE